MRNNLVKFFDRGLFLFLCLMLAYATFAIAGAEISFGFAFLFFILKKITQRASWKKIIPWTKLNLPIFCFLAACLISSIISIEPGKSFYALIAKTLEYVIIYFLFVECVGVNKERFNLILILLFVSCGLSVIDGFFQQVHGVDFMRLHPLVNNWLTAGFKYYNDFAAYLILILLPILGAFFYKKIKLPIRFFAILPLTILTAACLALTYSRGAWVGFLVGFVLLFIGIFIYSATPKQRIYLPILIIAFCAIVAFIAPPAMKQRAMSIFQLDSAGRLGKNGLWMQAITLVKYKVFLGQGLGVYRSISNGTYAHNCYLQMLTEIGIVGLLCFLWILGRLFRLGIENFKKSRDSLLLGLLAGIIAFSVHSFFDTNLYSVQLSILFWAILGITSCRLQATSCK